MHRTALRFIASSSALALSLVAGAAAGSVTEPNLLVVPQPAPVNETSLNVFFADKGEAIDWQADAYTTPNAFSPLCGFTATYVLNDAGSSFGLAWYNETGVLPQSTDLHLLVPAGQPVGTLFTGTAIASDPAYQGGLVGFALVGGETHYTNDSYDTDCSGCKNPGPWVTALMYASKNTPNAFYVCFEDGSTSSTSWNNDGDFNDDVYFITGITCSGGGQPCDTGKPGICASGVTQCAGSGTSCQQLNQPTTEACNGLDDDCNGQVDDGDLCPNGKVCEEGVCVTACGAVSTCPAGKACDNLHCIDQACVGVTCASGQVCSAGSCKAACDGVVCPTSQVCRVGTCVDLCAGVTCQSGDVCNQGVCVVDCSCLPCATGSSCDSTSGLCVDPACVGVGCAAGTTCAGGTCVDNCASAICPSGETCTAGNCVETPDAGHDAGHDAAQEAGQPTEPDGGAAATLPDSGHGTEGDGGKTKTDSGQSKDGGGATHPSKPDATTADGGSMEAAKSSGCGCRAAGTRSHDSPAYWAFGIVGLVALRRAAGRRKR
jgi:hypothetical protein